MPKPDNFNDLAWIERPAKLFEAGEYPDKGITVTEEDLDKIIAGTPSANIKVEHMPTPFDGALGAIHSLYRKGKELLGTFRVPDYVWNLMEASGAKNSQRRHQDGQKGIGEVSLVRDPRVESAAVFKKRGLDRLLRGSDRAFLGRAFLRMTSRSRSERSHTARR